MLFRPKKMLKSNRLKKIEIVKNLWRRKVPCSQPNQYRKNTCQFICESTKCLIKNRKILRKPSRGLKSNALSRVSRPRTKFWPNRRKETRKSNNARNNQVKISMKSIRGKWCNSGIRKCSVKFKKMRTSPENHPSKKDRTLARQVQKENQNNNRVQNSC